MLQHIVFCLQKFSELVQSLRGGGHFLLYRRLPSFSPAPLLYIRHRSKRPIRQAASDSVCEPLRLYCVVALLFCGDQNSKEYNDDSLVVIQMSTGVLPEIIEIGFGSLLS